MAVDSVVFRKSVEIGSLLLLSSQVGYTGSFTERTLLQICYTTERFMQLAVNAQVLDIEQGNLEVCAHLMSRLQVLLLL